MKIKDNVICRVCNRVYVGRVLEGEDGSMIVPRLHKIKSTSGTIKEYCPGSHQEGIPVEC